jgi:DHA1 family multidrug resistance protein-like MFS transporter
MFKLLSISFVFTLSIGLSYVIIPLYAHELGLSGLSIGSLFTIPMIIQIITRFIGGPITDRFGAKKVLIFAVLSLSLSGVIFYIAHSYVLLLLGQIVLIIGRGFYWPVIQTLVSHLSNQFNVTMGRLNASSNAGQLGGLIVSGFLISMFGFHTTFLFFTIIGIGAFLIAIFIPSPQPLASSSSLNVFKMMFLLLRQPIMFFAMLCSFIAAQPHAIGQSFHSIYMKEAGVEQGIIGFIMSFRAIGGIIIGFLLARFIKPTHSAAVPVLCTLIVASVFLITPYSHHVFILSFIFLGFGMASEVMGISYQVIASEVSESNQRGSALVVAGLGWSFAHLISPIIFGLFVDTFNLTMAFYLWGGIIFLVGISAIPLHRIAFKSKSSSEKIY